MRTFYVITVLRVFYNVLKMFQKPLSLYVVRLLLTFQFYSLFSYFSKFSTFSL